MTQGLCIDFPSTQNALLSDTHTTAPSPQCLKSCCQLMAIGAYVVPTVVPSLG